VGLEAMSPDRKEKEMVNEGIILNNDEVLLKSAMLNELANLEETTPEELQRVVFHFLTGHAWEEVDWDREDNQAGAFLWIKTFDRFLAELAEDGYVRTHEHGGETYLVPGEQDPPIDYSQVGFRRASH